MNFLAHLYLSGDNTSLKVGNFIADTVKGKAYQNFPEDIQKGILLHRFIDDFTDKHPIVEETKIRLRPKFRKYSPVVADVFYDHFLAKNWQEYHQLTLKKYVTETYKELDSQKHHFTEQSRHIFRYMKQFDWLGGYANFTGIGRALTGMSRRANFKNNMHIAVVDLKKDYPLYEKEFKLFFEDLMDVVNKRINE